MKSFAEAVRVGLSRRPKSLPPQFFYDARGSELFERICALPEYTLTRVETEILTRHASEIPASDTIVEFGCGNGAKTRIVLERMLGQRNGLTYVPVDISSDALNVVASTLQQRYPAVRVRSIAAEYEDAFRQLPPPPALVLFLGSNIGNFDAEEARRFLKRLRGYSVLVGFDMKKDPALLHGAYNDSRGVTAEFNLNLLARINRELGGEFDLARFRHYAFYNPSAGRVEMHLVSAGAQKVAIRGLLTELTFDDGESIHTENSYKFSGEEIRRLAEDGGFRVDRVWTDAKSWFWTVLMTPDAR